MSKKLILILILVFLALIAFFGDNKKVEPPSKKLAERNYSLSFGAVPFGKSEKSMEKILDNSVDKISEGADIYLAVALWSRIDEPFAVSLFERGIAKAREKGLNISLYIDVTNPDDRTTIALPSNVAYSSLSWKDESVRKAYADFVLSLMEKYRPEYLGLGVEVDTLYLKNLSEFIAYADAVNEVSKELKELYPDTFIYVSVQYDRLIRSAPESESLELFDYFNDNINLGLSLYPWQFYSEISDIPENYLEKAYNTKKPVYIAETSWSSASEGVLPGSLEQQKEFVNWLHNEALKGGINVITWWSVNDFESPGDPTFSFWNSQGLVDKKFNEKPAWDAWIGSYRE